MKDKALLVLASLTFKDSGQLIEGLKRLHWRILFNVYAWGDSITIAELIRLLDFQGQSKQKIVTHCKELQAKNLITYSGNGNQSDHTMAINKTGGAAVQNYILELYVWIGEKHPKKEAKPLPV